MQRHHEGSSLLTLLALGTQLAACAPQENLEHYDFPHLELSADHMDFGVVALGESASETLWLSNAGELPMGFGIALGTTDQSMGNYRLEWSLDELECPELQASAKDSGWRDTGSSSFDEPEIEVPAIPGEGCRLPLQVTFEPYERGTLYGSVIVQTGNEFLTVDGIDIPTVFADPLHGERVVTLGGEGEDARGNILVSPRQVDFGHLWPGDTTGADITVENSGDGALELAEPTLSGCPDSVAITDPGLVGALEPGASTTVALGFTPDSTSAVSCALNITSDDEDSPIVVVELTANSGVHHDNEPPSVVIESPGEGTAISSDDDLELAIRISDPDQPADTLTCQVRSMVLAGGSTVADCQAPDASGSVLVDIPFDSAGTDTLLVRVMDASDVLAFASISVLWEVDPPENDSDGDGWGPEPDEEGNADCDDASAATYPKAAELPDGQDNDCDGVIDEGTSAYDDDGDCFSEEQGDCNDQLPEAYPGAWEVADYLDNDCDGVVDEGTSLHDDDGDSYSEMDQDCDDDDPSVHPGAIEYCDGVDNDCDGWRDYEDGCIELFTEPYIAGGVVLEQTACEPGDTIAASVLAHDGDGQVLDYTWSVTEGAELAPLVGSPTVEITCPAPSDPGGSILELSAIATDEDGNSAWAIDELRVYPSGALYRKYASRGPSQSSCATSGAVPVVSLAWLVFVGAALYRRRGF